MPVTCVIWLFDSQIYWPNPNFVWENCAIWMNNTRINIAMLYLYQPRTRSSDSWHQISFFYCWSHIFLSIIWQLQLQQQPIRLVQHVILAYISANYPSFPETKTITKFPITTGSCIDCRKETLYLFTKCWIYLHMDMSKYK